MKRSAIGIGVILVGILTSSAEDLVERPHYVPKDFKLLYSQEFKSPEALSDFIFSDPQAWRYRRIDGEGCLELFQQSKYEPRVRSPFNIALIKDRWFSDFVLEVELMQTSREYPHRDMCIFFGMKDRSNFYYVHLATQADPNAHNIFIVNDEPRRAIATYTTKGVNWGTNQWHKVRIERITKDGTIRVYFDDMEQIIMEGKDTHFDYGLIGFGSFDDTGLVRRIRVWGPDFATLPKEFFH